MKGDKVSPQHLVFRFSQSERNQIKFWKRWFVCKHPIENIVIYEVTGANSVTGYCNKCYKTISFMPIGIHEILEEIINL
jgi:hypothetical protein